jgi:hypothetical protein
MAYQREHSFEAIRQAYNDGLENSRSDRPPYWINTPGLRDSWKRGRDKAQKLLENDDAKS